MKIFKAVYHVRAFFFFRLFLKTVYGRRLNIGRKTSWRKGFSCMIYKSGKVDIGEGCFFNNYCSVCSISSITIGSGTILGENVKIYDHNHIYSDPDVPIKDQGYTSAPIVIGSHCWIGSNVTILKGVTVGDNSVIGAGCVVYKDIPPCSIARLSPGITDIIKISPDK